MKIATKLYVGFGTVIFLTLLLGMFMVITLNDLSSGINQHAKMMEGMDEKTSQGIITIAETAAAKSSLAYVIVIIAVLLGVGYSFVISKSLINPINSLSKAANKVSKGDTKVKIVRTTDDEIGDLVDSFNRMVAGIKIMMSGDTKSKVSRNSKGGKKK